MRAGHKAAFTKYETRVDDLVADHAITSEKLCEAEALFSTLQNMYKTILRWDAEIELYIEDDAKLAQEREAFSDYETRMNIAMARLSALIDNIKTQLKAGLTATASTLSSLPTTGHMRLPKLQMPTFTGAYTDWVSFSDLFQAAMGSSSLLSDSERLNYLKACIKGDAAKIISSLRITDANYLIAWQLLKDRYDNTRSIVHAHLQAIWSQSSMKVESGSGLRKLHETTNEHLRALEALGRPVNQWSAVLVFCIADKLEAESRKQWQLKHPGKNVLRWDDLSKFFDERSRALESGAIKVIPQASKMSYQREPRHQPYAASMACSEKCDVEHKHHAGPKFQKMSTSQKYDLVKKKKRACFNCLQTGHSVSECVSKFSCRECKAKHHTLLYRPKPATTLHGGSNKTIARVSISVNTTIQSGGSAGQQADTSVLTEHCGSGSPNAGALLPTAVVPIHNKSD